MKPTALPFLPEERTLDGLRAAAAKCQGCPLWEPATQTVFGEGQPTARVMLVGEQPGDKEDRAGRPFVGPSGQLLDDAMAEAGLDRGLIYITNVVKHFKFQQRGKRRIHEKPRAAEIQACRPWLDAELTTLRPSALVLLGSTAAQAILGKEFRVTKQRGELIPSPLAPLVLATLHPAAILRTVDPGARKLQIEQLTSDLRRVATALPTH